MVPGLATFLVTYFANRNKKVKLLKEYPSMTLFSAGSKSFYIFLGEHMMLGSWLLNIHLRCACNKNNKLHYINSHFYAILKFKFLPCAGR